MLILLVGPKGSGKSHIGRLLESVLGVHFFHVEPLWMEYQAECRADGRDPVIPDGVARVHPFIEETLAVHGRVCVETTGASDEILHDLLRIGLERGLLIVRVSAPLELCLERISSRDPAHQIPMDHEMIERVHDLASRVDLPWDAVIENVSASDTEIVDLFRTLLESDGNTSG